MNLSDVCLIVGVAIVLVGLLGARWSSTLKEKRRWIIWVGVIALTLGAILGGPDFIRGIRDGLREG